MTGKGLPLLLIDDVLLACTEYGTARLTVIGDDIRLRKVEQISALEIIKGTKARKYGDALHDLTAYDAACGVDDEEDDCPCDETPFCLADGDASLAER